MTPETNARIEDTIVRLARESSRDALARLAGGAEVVVGDFPGATPRVLAHRLCLQRARGPALALNLKIHFDHDAVSRLKNVVAGADAISSQIKSLSQDYSDTLRARLRDRGIDLGASPPAISRGSDEILREEPTTARAHAWSLVCGNGSIRCSIDIDILVPAMFERL